MIVLEAVTKHILNDCRAQDSLATARNSIQPKEGVAMCFPIEVLLTSEKPGPSSCLSFLKASSKFTEGSGAESQLYNLSRV